MSVTDVTHPRKRGAKVPSVFRGHFHITPLSLVILCRVYYGTAMNERWRQRINELKQAIPEPLQQEWRQHVVPQWKSHVEAPIKDKINRRKLAPLEKMFQDTDDLAILFENARTSLVTHIGEVMKGRGGNSEAEAEQLTAAHIDYTAEILATIAKDIAVNRKHALDPRDPDMLFNILKADAEIRREGLEKLLPKNRKLSPTRDDYLQSITYSLVDPQKDSVVDLEMEKKIRVIPPEEALELYKRTIADHLEAALWGKIPNITEYGDPHASLKRAVKGVGAAAVVALIFGAKKKY